MEFHHNWAESSIGPTAAVSLGARITSRLEIQGQLAGSAPIKTSGVYYLACPTCTREPQGPTGAWGGIAELVFRGSGDRAGLYALGGLGFVHFTGNKVAGAPTRAQIEAGAGVVMGQGSSQFFAEGRLSYVPNAGAYPQLLVPLRLGWRKRL